MSGFGTNRHGNPGINVARLSDAKNHRDGANANEDERPANRTRGGQVGPGNRLAVGTGTARMTTALVPKKGRQLYRRILSELGVQGGTIAAVHVADSVRNHLAAAELHELAMQAGLDTAKGAELHARAQRSSELAMRATVAALEVARLLKSPRARKRSITPVGFEEET